MGKVTGAEVKFFKIIRKMANCPLSANESWNKQKFGITEALYKKMKRHLYNTSIDPNALYIFDNFKWLSKVKISSFDNMPD